MKRYGPRTVVDGLTLQVERGEIIGLLGPNGAGKTTTFYMMVGLVRPNAGEVWLDDKNLTRFPVHRRARLGIGYLAQEPSVFRGLTVEENILIVLEANGKPPRARRETMEKLLEEFGLIRVRRQLGVSLSGGERRRVEIARVLAMEPSYMLLDEPFTGIDPKSVTEIQDVVRYLRARGLGVIVTDHNVRDTLAITDRSLIIYEGSVRVALEQHLGTGVMLRLVVLRLPYFIILSLPMALLLGALLAVGRLSDHNEVVAMRTGGISLGRMAVPVFVAGVLVAATSLALGEYVVPLVDQRYWEEVRRATRQAPPARGYVLFREEDGPRVSIYYARKVSEDGAILEGVVVNQEEAGRLARLIVANTARFVDGRWVFEEVVAHELSAGPRLEIRFKRLEAGIRRTPREVLAERKEPADMSIRELRGYINVLRRSGESVARYLVWLHSRIALPISSITLDRKS